MEHAAPTSQTFAAYTRLGCDGVAVVVLRGRLDAASVPVVEAVIESAVRLGSDQVRVDLAGVQHWSLLVESLVLSTAQALRADGRELVLLTPGPALRRDPGRLGLLDRLTTVPDLPVPRLG